MVWFRTELNHAVQNLVLLRHTPLMKYGLETKLTLSDLFTRGVCRHVYLWVHGERW